MSEFDPSAGNYVRGIPLSDSIFLATTRFGQLKTITRDPQLLQAGARRSSTDAFELENESEIHELIQRALTGNKRANVGKYATYIESVVRGSIGVLPPMHLWSQDRLKIEAMSNGHFALIPHGERLLAIDGETQLTGHYRVSERALTPELRKGHAEYPLAAVIHHGIDVRAARQYFHDLNVLAVRPNTSLGLAMDTNDELMNVVGSVETLDVLLGRVDKQNRQLAKRSAKLVTLQALRQMVINIARGITGVQYGARPAPIDDLDMKDLEEVSRSVVGQYFATFLPEIADRERSLAGAGPVLAAVGAMGNEVFRAPVAERPDRLKALIDSLSEVNWAKGDHWVGIAGNVTPRGAFSVKGTKEVAYAVYNALSDPTSPGYRRIR